MRTIIGRGHVRLGMAVVVASLFGLLTVGAAASLVVNGGGIQSFLLPVEVGEPAIGSPADTLPAVRTAAHAEHGVSTDAPTPAATASPTPTTTASPTPTLEPTASPTSSPVDPEQAGASPTPTLAPASPSPTAESTPQPTVEPSPSPSPTPSPEPTPTPTAELTPTP